MSTGALPTAAPTSRQKFDAPIRLAALRVPLVVKLVGANALIVAALFAVWLLDGGVFGGLAAALAGLVIAAHAALVLIALRPVRDLEVVASRVWNGDIGARVGRSVMADDGVLRIGSMFNILLDDLARDRAQMRALASEVIAAGDRERAALARELHDSTAQRVAALLLQLSSAARDANDPALTIRLLEARDAAEGVLEELRSLSHTMYPELLKDLGLEAALRRLARDASNGIGVDIDVNAESSDTRLPAPVEAGFYRIAQEAVHNATTHASPRRIRINVYRSAGAASLEVHDDGSGFDVEGERLRRAGMGLSSMRERALLLDGQLDIKTALGSGTTILATVPLHAETDIVHSENV